VTAAEQLTLEFRPHEGQLEERLRALGLGQRAIRLHRNRTVLVSLTPRGVLRIHRGYAYAPDRVLEAVIRWCKPRVTRSVRRAAEREFLAWPVHQFVPPESDSPRRHRPQEDDHALLSRLRVLHNSLNTRHFDGTLTRIPIRLSSRMKTRLGEVVLDRSDRAIEIAISRRHIRRDGWKEVEHTLLHEMVHQWQAETGLPVDHGSAFRTKALALGIEPRANRLLDRDRRSPKSGAPATLLSLLFSHRP